MTIYTQKQLFIQDNGIHVLSSQVTILARHCLLSGRYFESCLLIQIVCKKFKYSAVNITVFCVTEWEFH